MDDGPMDEMAVRRLARQCTEAETALAVQILGARALLRPAPAGSR